MRIIADRELQPGDLFSTVGSQYWDEPSLLSVGEKVYIRTEVPAQADELEVIIYRIRIER